MFFKNRTPEVKKLFRGSCGMECLHEKHRDNNRAIPPVSPVQMCCPLIALVVLKWK